MTKQVLYFGREPRGVQYCALIRWLLSRSDEFWVVLRDPLVPAGNIANALEKLSPWRISAEEVSEWPGTRILGSATRYRHQCAPEAVPVLFELSDGLFDWVHPNLPEDLCFTADTRALLVNIAHENEAYLDLTDAEERDLRTAMPDLYEILSAHPLPKGWSS